MADSNFRGPLNSMGALEVDAATSQILPMDGPSNFYQGFGWLDQRGGAFAKDNFRPGQVPSFLNVMDVYALDGAPQANSTTALAAAQVVTAATGMSLATVGVTNFSAAVPSIAVGVPIIPSGTTVATTANFALDFGFTTGTTVANSSAMQVPDSAQFTNGQWLIVGNVGNSTATRSLVTQVASIAAGTTTLIFISPTPATAMGVPIGQGNLFGGDLLPPGTQFGPQTQSASAHSLGGRQQGGLGRYMNPREMFARGLVVQASTVQAGTGTILITGWDVWGVPMTELITALGTTPAYGKKAWKYVQSAVPQTLGTTITATYTLGISDVFGFPFRVDQPEYLTVTAGGTAVANSVGITTAVLTGATNTSGDVRGTVQVSGIGGGTALSAVSTTNNVKRLVVIQSLNNFQTLFTNPNSLTPTYGTTQV